MTIDVILLVLLVIVWLAIIAHFAYAANKGRRWALDLATTLAKVERLSNPYRWDEGEASRRQRETATAIEEKNATARRRTPYLRLDVWATWL